MAKNTLRFLLSIFLLALPAFASGIGTIAVEDVVAGYDTIAKVSGVAPHASLEVHVIAPTGDDTAIPTLTNGNGAVTISIPARLATESGEYRVFAASGRSKVTTETTFTVLSQGLDDRRSTIVTDDAFLQADGKSMTVVTVTLRDAQGSPLPGRPVQIVGSRPHDRITPLTATRETDSAGRVRFAVQSLVPGEIVLRAMDLISGKVIAGSARIEAVDDASMGGFEPWTAQVAQAPAAESYDSPLQAQAAAAAMYDVVSAFVIEVSTPNMKVRDILPLVTIKAVDASGQVVQDFTGTVRIETPNDTNSTLPGYFDEGGDQSGGRYGKVTFTGKNRGVFPIAWSMSFTKSGEQPIKATDESGTISGETTVMVTGNTEIPEGKRITIETPKDGDTVSSLEIVIEGKGPALSNLNVWAKPAGTPAEEVTTGDPVATGDTGAQGSFSISVTMPDAEEVMLQVQDEKAQYDSGVITVRLDRDGPEIRFSVDPESPREGEAVTFKVESEASLSRVMLAIDGKEYDMTEVDTGEYQVPILAPASGDSAFTIEARDAAGNVSLREGILVVSGPELPQVQNVKTSAVAGGIEVSWDRVPDETITAYRIEVGKSPNVVDFPLDTPEATDSAAVMGLKAGIDYFLTVRALRGEQAGPKSSQVMARTLGIELTVKGETESLLLQWSFPDSTPLSSFILEYGPGEEFYSEKRTLDGGMRVYTIKNLLTQPYYVRLTPIATNGQTLSELAVTGTGTPTAGAFHASAEDALGQRPSDVAPPNDLHDGAPETPGSGLPAIPLWLVAILTVIAVVMYLLRRKHRLQETQAFLRRMQDTYRQ